MLKMKKMFLLLSSFAMVMGFVAGGNTASAQEGNGGQVQTNGEISFYADEPLPSSSSEPPAPSSTQEPSSEAPVPTSSSEPPVTKPAGKYPSTGELVKKSLTISGGVVLLIGLFLFLYSRKKKEAGE